jgi:hypothetical protein
MNEKQANNQKGIYSFHLFKLLSSIRIFCGNRCLPALPAGRQGIRMRVLIIPVGPALAGCSFHDQICYCSFILKKRA